MPSTNEHPGVDLIIVKLEVSRGHAIVSSYFVQNVYGYIERDATWTFGTRCYVLCSWS
jgi:hypothetical protein